MRGKQVNGRLRGMRQRVPGYAAPTNTALPTGVRERVSSSKGALNAKQLAEILGVTGGIIYKQARLGLIPHFRVGTSVRFDPRAICDWLDKEIL